MAARALGVALVVASVLQWYWGMNILRMVCSKVTGKTPPGTPVRGSPAAAPPSAKGEANGSSPAERVVHNTRGKAKKA